MKARCTTRHVALLAAAALAAGAVFGSWMLFSGSPESRQSSVAGTRIAAQQERDDVGLIAAIAKFRRNAAQIEAESGEPTAGEVLVFFNALLYGPALEAEQPTIDDVLTFFQALLYGAPPQGAQPTVGEVLVFFHALLYEPGPTPPLPSVADTLIFFHALLYGGESTAAPQPPPAAEPPPAARAPAPPPLATPVPPPPPAPPAAQTAADVWTEASFTQAVWDGVNARRAAAGLGGVAPEGRLHVAAYDYAILIAETRWFSHTGPDGSSFVDRIEAAGFPFTVQVGEVLAMGSHGWPPGEVVQAWIDSPPHREQLLNAAYTRAGLECAFSHENGALMVRCVMEFAAG
jgi:uncharacterized protein YkwD